MHAGHHALTARHQDRIYTMEDCGGIFVQEGEEVGPRKPLRRPVTSAKVEKVASYNTDTREVGLAAEPEKSEEHLFEKSSVITVRPKITRILKSAVKVFENEGSINKEDRKPNGNSEDGDIMVNNEASPKKSSEYLQIHSDSQHDILKEKERRILMLEQELEIQKRLRCIAEKTRFGQNQDHTSEKKSEEEDAMLDAVKQDGLEEVNDKSTLSYDPTYYVGVPNDDSLSYIMSEESGCFTSPGSNSTPSLNHHLEQERVQGNPLILTSHEQRLLEEHRWRVLEDLEQCRMTNFQEIQEAARREVVAKQKLNIQCMADDQNMVVRSQDLEHERVVEEQRMILKAIQQQQEERKRDEELNIRLIQKLNLEEEQSFSEQIEVERLRWRKMEERSMERPPAPRSSGLSERERMLEEWAAENRRREAEEEVRRSMISNSRKKLNIVASLDEVRSGAWAAEEVEGGWGGVGEGRSQSARQKNRNQVNIFSSPHC